jgi:hypothetical protein
MIGSLCTSTLEKLRMHWSDSFQALPARSSLKGKLQTSNTNMNTHCKYKFSSRPREKTVCFLKKYRSVNIVQA